MTENSLYILVGAVAGVLAVLVLLVAGELWTHTLQPLLRRWRYQGVNIAGEWKGLGTGYTSVPGEWSEVALVLKQDMVDLRGLMVLRHRSPGRSFDLSLPLAGTIANGYVTLGPASPAATTSNSAATALLKVDGGAALTGQLLFRDPVVDGIDVINLSVYRAESMVMPRLRPVIGLAPAGQLLLAD